MSDEAQLRMQLKQAHRDFTMADMSHPSTPNREERKEAARRVFRQAEAGLRELRLKRESMPESRSAAKRLERLKAQARR